MLIRPDHVTHPSIQLRAELARATPLRGVRDGFIASCALPILWFCFEASRTRDVEMAVFHAAVLASALTAASAPVLMRTYRLHTLRRLVSANLGEDALACRCRALRAWLIVAAASLALLVLSLNLSTLWVFGSATLHRLLWDVQWVPVLKSGLYVGLVGLFLSDRAIARA